MYHSHRRRPLGQRLNAAAAELIAAALLLPLVVWAYGDERRQAGAR